MAPSAGGACTSDAERTQRHDRATERVLHNDRLRGAYLHSNGYAPTEMTCCCLSLLLLLLLLLRLLRLLIAAAAAAAEIATVGIAAAAAPAAAPDTLIQPNPQLLAVQWCDKRNKFSR